MIREHPEWLLLNYAFSATHGGARFIWTVITPCSASNAAKRSERERARSERGAFAC